jgi:hypothetical protein
MNRFRVLPLRSLVLLLSTLFMGGLSSDLGAQQSKDNKEPQTSEPQQPAVSSGTGSSKDDFKPSEEVSEDLSVAFPVDI